MAEFPALPFFTDAFIADTTHLNAMQTGAYLMLLFCAWRSPDCKLPNDDKILSRMARMDGRAWAAHKGVIMAFWKQDDQQKWYQRRLLDERNHVEDVRRKNAEAGRSSALKRKGRHVTDVQPKANETATPLTPPTPKEKKVTKVTQEKPEDVDLNTWEDWMRVRKAKKAVMTENVIPRIRIEAAKLGWSLQRTIEECNYKSWSGFNAKWIENENTRTNTTGYGKTSAGNSAPSRSRQFIDAGEAIIAKRNAAEGQDNSGQHPSQEPANPAAIPDLRPVEKIW